MCSDISRQIFNKINVNVPWIKLPLFIYLLITMDTFINNSVDISLLTLSKGRILRSIHWQILIVIPYEPSYVAVPYADSIYNIIF